MSKLEIATIGGGCFWCIETIFREVKGVEDVFSGYSGGKYANPTYREVCSGLSEHAEVIQINFNPEIISFSEILDIFWSIHDPTTLNRQGADIGTQYRSVIFYHNEEQKEIALKSKDNLEKSKVYSDKIITEISPLKEFFKAEEYHQNYFNLNPNEGYCQMVIKPKIEKFKSQF